MSQVIIKVKRKKKKQQQKEEDSNSRWSEDRIKLESIHQDISPLIPLPNEQIKQIETNSWFIISKMGQNKSSYRSIPSHFEFQTNKVVGNHFVRLSLTKQMESLFKITCHTVRFLYNQCVNFYKRNNKITDKQLRELLINKGTNIFEGSKYEEMLSKVPYDIKREAIRDFFKAVKIQWDLFKEGKRKYFEMKYRKKKRDQNFVLHKKHIQRISEQEIQSYPKTWPHNLFCKGKFPKIEHDCRVIWKRTGEFLLMVPTNLPIRENSNLDICALDPGARTFQTSYDNKGISYQFGSGNYYSKLEPLVRIAERMRSGIKREFKEGKRIFRPVKNLKEREGLSKAALRVEQKISNLVLELHRKTANFLCSQYKTIILPKFETQNMCQKRDLDGNWKRKIGKKSSQSLSRLSHYQFQQLLKFKGEQTRTKIVIGHERSSTKTCTNCLALNQEIGGSERFVCSECGMSFGRDIQAARNILLINWDKAGHCLEKKKRKIRIVSSSE